MSNARNDSTPYWFTGRVLEQFHSADPDDDLPPELELVDVEDGFEYRFRDTGLRLEIDGETFVPEDIAPRKGYVTFAKESDREGVVSPTEMDIKIHVDMSSSLIATGGDDGE